MSFLNIFMQKSFNKIQVKTILTERCGIQLDSSSLGHRSVADYCEYGNEPSGSKKYENV